MTAASATNSCVKCSAAFPPSELLVSASGPICASCNLDADADAMMAGAVVRQAGIALGLAIVGGPIRFEINGLNLVALVSCPLAVILGVRALLTARKVGNTKAVAMSAAAIAIAAVVFGYTCLALLG